MGMLCFSLGLRLIVLIDWQMNQAYIAKNLCEKRNEVNSCCQGKCQLKKRIDKLDGDYQQPSDEKKKPENEKSFAISHEQGSHRHLQLLRHSLVPIRSVGKKRVVQ